MSTRIRLHPIPCTNTCARASRVDVKKLEKQEAKLRVRDDYYALASARVVTPSCSGQDREAFEAYRELVRGLEATRPTQETGALRPSLAVSHLLRTMTAANIRRDVHEDQSSRCRRGLKEQVQGHPPDKYRCQLRLESHLVRSCCRA